jgi:FkbM family methyltransferase
MMTTRFIPSSGRRIHSRQANAASRRTGQTASFAGVTGMIRLVESVRRAAGYRFPPLGRQAFRTLFRLLPPRANVEIVPGIRVDLDFSDDTMRATYWQGDRFERPTAQRLDRWAEGATHFFDIGSNYGFFSFLMLSRRPALEVHAFEPHPMTYARLDAARAANRLLTLHAWNFGLSDSQQRLVLHPGFEDSGHSTFGPHPALIQSDLCEVNVISFDHWCDAQKLVRPTRPSWVAKIDVEGFETRVLQGMAESLRARAFVGLVVEVNEYTLSFCGSSGSELRQILNDSGYREQPPPPKLGNAFFVPAD